MRRRRDENPSLAESFDLLRADYNAAKASRFRRTRAGVSGTGRSGDYHYRTEGDFLRLMEIARDFIRNDVVVGQAVRRLVHNVVRDGFTLDPQTHNSDADEILTRRWAEWTGDPARCELAGEHNWHRIEQLALQQTIVDGDLIVLLTNTGAVELVEAHRMRTPTNAKRSSKYKNSLVHGVLLDENRRRREYWITKNDIDPNQTVSRISDMKRYPARDRQGNRLVLHVYRPDRVSQTRGVSALAPVVDVVSQHDECQFAQMVKQQVSSAFAILRQQADPHFLRTGSAPTAVQLGARETETLSDGTTRTLEGIGPGMIYTGQPGETLTGFSPNVPNPEFFKHTSLLLTFISINLGLPLQVLLLDPTKTNFSGWRGAIDQARMGFLDLQNWLIASLHSPVYRWQVRNWATTDPVLRELDQLPGVDLLRHRFHPPSWPYIEPLKDASADLLQVRNGMLSHRRRCAKRGLNWEEVSAEIVADNALLIRKAEEAAQKLNLELNLNLSWRELAMLPTPDGVTVTTEGDSRAGEQGSGTRDQGAESTV